MIGLRRQGILLGRFEEDGHEGRDDGRRFKRIQATPTILLRNT